MFKIYPAAMMQNHAYSLPFFSNASHRHMFINNFGTELQGYERTTLILSLRPSLSEGQQNRPPFGRPLLASPGTLRWAAIS